MGSKIWVGLFPTSPFPKQQKYPFRSSIGSEENPSIQQRWAEGLWQFLGMVSMAVWIQIVGEPLFFLLNSLGSLFFLLFLPGLSPPHVNKEFIE